MQFVVFLAYRVDLKVQKVYVIDQYDVLILIRIRYTVIMNSAGDRINDTKEVIDEIAGPNV